MSCVTATTRCSGLHGPLPPLHARGTRRIPRPPPQARKSRAPTLRTQTRRSLQGDRTPCTAGRSLIDASSPQSSLHVDCLSDCGHTEGTPRRLAPPSSSILPGAETHNAQEGFPGIPYTGSGQRPPFKAGQRALRPADAPQDAIYEYSLTGTFASSLCGN
jgi:hypothetical protein